MSRTGSIIVFTFLWLSFFAFNQWMEDDQLLKNNGSPSVLQRSEGDVSDEEQKEIKKMIERREQIEQVQSTNKDRKTASEVAIDNVVSRKGEQFLDGIDKFGPIKSEKTESGNEAEVDNVRPTESGEEQQSMDAVDDVGPIDSAKEKQSMDAADNVGPIDSAKEKQSMDAADNVGPIDSAKEKQSMDAFDNVGPIDSAKEKQSMNGVENVGPLVPGKVIEVNEKSKEVGQYESVKVKSAKSNTDGHSNDENNSSRGCCCPKILKKTVPVDKFQKVSNISYVYSAYFDGRPESGQPSVRVMGVVALNSTMYCHLWFKGDREPIIVLAEFMVLKHFMPVTYENAVISCPFSKSGQMGPRVPSQLVLSSSKCGPPDAILDVIDNSALSPEVNFTVCLHKAFILNYNNSNEFVEWIEMNRILGAQRFLIYNFTGGSALTPFLQHYVDEGLVELHDWPVGRFLNKIPGYGAQGALINDCIYRAMYKSRHLMLIDVDEVMVPQKVDTWEKALEKENNCKGKQLMLVRNSYFFKNYKDNSTKKHSNIEFLDLVHRINFTHPCPIRTKILMRPEYARSAGVHIVLEHSDGTIKENCCLSPDDFLLHHYRVWKKSMKDAWVEELYQQVKYDEGWENVILHPRMMHFQKELIRNVNKIRKISPG